MRILGIDTATEACSVALWDNGRVLEQFECAGRTHSVRLPQMVPAILAEAGLSLSQLDGLACGIGPGSFAGVRIGVSYAKGLALGLGLPVVGVTSLAMLAQALLGKYPDRVALAAIDARMDEVYFAAYRAEAGLAVPLQPACVCAPDAVSFAGALAVDAPIVAAGSGWAAHGPAMLQGLGREPESIDATALPHAADALALAVQAFGAGQGVDAAALVPAYLRNRVALTKLEQAAQRAVAAAAKG